MNISYEEYVRVMAGESTKKQIVVRRFREVNDQVAVLRELRAHDKQEHEAYRTRMNNVLDLCWKAAVGQPLETTDPTLAGTHEVQAVVRLRQEVMQLRGRVYELTEKLAAQKKRKK